MNKQAQEDVLPPLDEECARIAQITHDFHNAQRKSAPRSRRVDILCAEIQCRERQLAEALTRARKAEEERDVAIAVHGKKLLLLEADYASDIEIMARVIEALDGTPFSEPIPGERHSKFLSTPARVKKLRERAEAAESELAGLREENRWISVDERLPEEGIHVLTMEDGSVTMNYISYSHAFSIKGTSYVGFFASDHDFVTHWRPLPSPPSTLVQEDK